MAEENTTETAEQQTTEQTTEEAGGLEDLLKANTEATQQLLQTQQQTTEQATEDKVDVGALEVPEGFEKLSDEMSSALQKVVDDHKLTKESAQSLINLHTDSLKASQESEVRAFEDWKTTLKNETLADSDIGGDKLDTSVKAALAALDKFGTPELRTLLNETGLSQHKEIVRVFSKIGSMLQNDTLVHGKDGPGAKSTFDILFGDTM